jgi:exodeoxyribonuclease V gamma subunit
MHSLPFKVVCLLGMNDGDFPRLSSHHPFDLMAQRGQARVGDRSKSSDDRGLMLQALLCARDKLYISWSAFNERDNSSKNPSVLVTQLRQYIAQKWSEELLDSITTTHPMQPFSAEYFKKDTKLYTYANEWLSIHEKTGIQKELLQKSTNKALKMTGAVKEDVCSLQQIIQCFKNPVKHFFKTGLSIDFYSLEKNQWDDELFGLDALQTFKIKDELLELFKKTDDKKWNIESLVSHYVSNLKLAGSLPLGPMGELLQESLTAEIVPQLNCALTLQTHHPVQLPDLILNFKFGELTVHQSISGLRATEPSQAHQARVCIELIANRLYSNKAMRHHQLLKPWILSTVFAHLELDVQLLFLFADVQFIAVKPSKEQADHVLEVLANLYAMSEIQFVAVPLKTALSYAKGLDLKRAKLIYEGSEHVFAEVNDLSLQRIFPDFEALIQDEGTLELWSKVFEPFWAWLDLQDTPKSYSKHVELVEG